MIVLYNNTNIDIEDCPNYATFGMLQTHQMR